MANGLSGILFLPPFSYVSSSTFLIAWIPYEAVRIKKNQRVFERSFHRLFHPSRSGRGAVQIGTQLLISRTFIPPRILSVQIGTRSLTDRDDTLQLREWCLSSIQIWTRSLTDRGDTLNLQALMPLRFSSIQIGTRSRTDWKNTLNLRALIIATFFHPDRKDTPRFRALMPLRLSSIKIGTRSLTDRGDTLNLQALIRGAVQIEKIL